MESFFGFISKKENNRSTSELLQLLSGSPDPNVRDRHYHMVSFNNVGIASYKNLPAENTNIISIVQGTPHWSDSKLSQIAFEQGPSKALLTSYQKYSDDFLRHMHGHFSFAIVDKKSEKLLIGIDRIGVQTLYYYSDSAHGIIFSSTVTELIKHPAVPADLSDQGIFNYMYFHMVPSPGCIYSKIKKMGPAQYLTFQNSNVEIVEYWRPNFYESLDVSIVELSTELKKLLSISVAESAATSNNIGCFLSGGIDSSTVVGTLSTLSSKPVKTFSIGFDAKGYDETPYARIVSEKFATNHSEYYVTPDDTVDFLPKMAAAYSEPFGNASAIPAYFCAKLSKESGIDVLLAGDGGDELFAGNERYAKQAVFEKYFILPSFFRKNIIEPLLKNIPGSNKFLLLHKLASYVEQANTPLPDRLEAYNFLHRIDIVEIFNQEFLNNINACEPIELIRNRYNAPDSTTKLNRMLYQDWKFTLADNDLRKVTCMAEFAGIEVAYPLLSDRLIDLSCKIPSRLKLKNQILRYFFKQAIRDLLPEKVIKKEKHGFGLPFGVWMRTHKPLQDLAYDSLNQLKQRRYFKTQFLDQAIELHRTEHAAYYGGLIWILMVLELWISSHSGHTG